ncbi:bifunctional diguanylate cyclase/phosphodiesterase [Zobellella aerophila]|uniref:LapD/MoxY N-terminal periplasmic domain-containing protein n=1 Tax=Zobellella aerophila TaxID=870480 RepID=A0ABP6V3T9_9GAMM
MTLYRQLLITMLFLFTVLFLTAYFALFNSTRDYLAEQQYTNVVNTATSLGLALTPYLETSDKVGAESVINAVFDGGFYRRVRLDLLAADDHILRENLNYPLSVPEWFVGLGLFKTVSYEAVLTSGWLQLGKLYIEGHPNQAYHELWNGMSRLASWFLFFFVIAWISLIISLRYLLKPLFMIRYQAKEIERHHFGKTIPLPPTRELRDVVSAINNMSAKLEVQFNDQAKEVERLRQKAFFDETSGLGNRSYFVSQVSSWITEGIRSAVILVSVDILDKIYQEEGFSSRDDMVRVIAERLRKICHRYHEFALSRISAKEYALLLPENDGDNLKILGNEINQTISELVVNPVEGDDFSVVGASILYEGATVSNLLASADNALNKARMESLGTVVVEQQALSSELGRLAWKKMLEDDIRNDQLLFSSQSVQIFNGSTYHRELFTAIKRDDSHFNAGEFINIIEQFNLGAEFDKHIIDKALEKLEEDISLKLAVNLTQQSCHSEIFWHQLSFTLAKHSSAAERLFLEIPESIFAHGKLPLEDHLAKLNVKWGIDHFGRHFDILGKLARLRPVYVKIDHAYTNQILEPDYDDAFLAAVCRAAHNIGAIVIATRVENMAQLDTLSRLHMDAYQGFVSPIESLT